jgi:hypothetical protein
VSFIFCKHVCKMYLPARTIGGMKCSSYT